MMFKEAEQRAAVLSSAILIRMRGMKKGGHTIVSQPGKLIGNG